METNNYVPEIYIGENGNWFINGVDTGQPSRGPQGKSAYEIAVTFGYRGTEAEWLSGLKGEQGSKGDKGDKGDSGDRGIKGDPGDKGAKGDPGAVGAQGIQGPKGEIDAINDQTPTYAVATSPIQLSSGEKVSQAFGKIAKAVSTLISHISLKAADTVSGHVKLSNSLSVTETGGYALDAVQANASVSGTLGNQISQLNTELAGKQNAAAAINTSNISSQSVKHAKTADAVAWDKVSGKPSVYTPETHAHDDRYYTEEEVNSLLAKKSNSVIFTSYEAVAQTIAATKTATYTINIGVSGYTPRMVQLYDTGSYNCFCYNCVISGSTVIVKLKNIATGSSASAAPKVIVLYHLM